MNSISKRNQNIEKCLNAWFCIFFCFWAYLLYDFSSEMIIFRKFQQGSSEICLINEIPPFVIPKVYGIQCCSPNFNPLVLNVTVESEQVLAFPYQDAICVCNENDYHKYIDNYKVGSNYSCRVEQLADYEVFLVATFTLQWSVIAFIVVTAFLILYCIFCVTLLKKQNQQKSIPLNEGDY